MYLCLFFFFKGKDASSKKNCFDASEDFASMKSKRVFSGVSLSCKSLKLVIYRSWICRHQDYKENQKEFHELCRGYRVYRSMKNFDGYLENCFQALLCWLPFGSLTNFSLSQLVTKTVHYHHSLSLGICLKSLGK